MSRSKLTQSLWLVALAALMVWIASPVAQAGDYTWDGDGGNQLWTDALNWQDTVLGQPPESGVVPIPGDTARFSGIVYTAGGDVFLNGDQQVDAVDFDDQVSGDQGFVIRGSVATDQLTTNTLDHGVTVGIDGSITNEIASMLQGGGGGGGTGLVMNVKSGNLLISGQVGEIGLQTDLTGSVVGGGTSATQLELSNTANEMTGTLEIQANGTVKATGGGMLGDATVQLNGGRLAVKGTYASYSLGLEARYYHSNSGTGPRQTISDADLLTMTPDDIVIDLAVAFNGDFNNETYHRDPVTGLPVALSGYNDNFAVRWDGFIMFPSDPAARVNIRTDDGGYIRVGDPAPTLYLETDNNENRGNPLLVAGEYMPVTMSQHEWGGGDNAWLKLLKPGADPNAWEGDTNAWYIGAESQPFLFHGSSGGDGAYGNDVEVLSTGTIEVDGGVQMGKLIANAAAPPAVLTVTDTPQTYAHSLSFTGGQLKSDLTIDVPAAVPTTIGAMDDDFASTGAKTLLKIGDGALRLGEAATTVNAATNLEVQDGSMTVVTGAAGDGLLTVNGGVLALEETTVDAVAPGWTTSGFSNRGWPGSLAAMSAFTPTDQVYGVDQTADKWLGGDGELRPDLGWTGYDNNFCMLWDGTLHITTGGDYTFDMSSDDEGNYWIEGQAEVWKDAANPTYTLAAGDYQIMTGFHEGGGGCGIWFNMMGPDTGMAWVRTGSVAGSITTIAPTQVTNFGNDVVLALGPADISVKGAADMGALTFNAGVSQLNVLDGGDTVVLNGRHELTFTGTAYQNSIAVNAAIPVNLGALDDSAAGGAVTLTSQGTGAGDVQIVDDVTPATIGQTTFATQSGQMTAKRALGAQPITLGGGALRLLEDAVVINYDTLTGDGYYYGSDRSEAYGNGFAGNNILENGTNTGTDFTGLTGTTHTYVGFEPINFNIAVDTTNYDPFSLGWVDMSAWYSINWLGTLEINPGIANKDVKIRTTSDDGTLVFIDGVLVVNNNGPHGMDTVEGTINKAAGTYSFDMGFTQGTGGHGAILEWSLDGGTTWELIPNTMLAVTPLTDWANVMTASLSTTINVDGTAKVAQLDIKPGFETLTVRTVGTGYSGVRELRFDLTQYGTDWNIDTDMDVYLGELNDGFVDPTIGVTGPGMVVADNTATQNNAGLTTYKVADGTMVLVGEAGGFDPVGSPGATPPDDGPSSVVELQDLANLVVSSKAGTAALGSDINATVGNSTLSARQIATGAAGLAVDLNGDITVSADAHLFVYLEDNYALRSNGKVGGEGTMEVDSQDLLTLNGTSSDALTLDIDPSVSRPTGTLNTSLNAWDNWTSSMYNNWQHGARVNDTSGTGIGTGWTVNVEGDAALDLQAVGGQMAATTNVKTLGTLKGDLANATYGVGGNVVFAQDSILVDETPGGNLPLRADLGGTALLLNGVTNLAGAYTAGDDAAAAIPDAIFNGVAFSHHFTPGGAFTGTLTVDADATSLQIALRDDQQFGDGATAATFSGAGKAVDITGPGKMTIAGTNKGLMGSVVAYNRYGYDEDTLRGHTAAVDSTVGHTHNLYILDLADTNVIKYYKHMNVEDGLIDVRNNGALMDEYFDIGIGDFVPGSEGVLNINDGATLWTTWDRQRPSTGVYNVNAGGAVKVRNWDYAAGPPESVQSTVNDPGATWNWAAGAWVILEDDDFYWSLAGLPNDVALNIIATEEQRFRGGLPMGDGSILTNPFDENGRPGSSPWPHTAAGLADMAIYEQQVGVSETMRFAAPENPVGGERWNMIDTNVTFGNNAVTGDDVLINDVAGNKYWLPRNQWRADFEQKDLTGKVVFLDGAYTMRNVTVMGGTLLIGHPWGDDRAFLDITGITGEITVNEDAVMEIRGFRPHVGMPDGTRLTQPFLDGLGTGISVENGGRSQFWTKGGPGAMTLNTGVTFLGGNPDKRAEFNIDHEWGNEWNLQMIMPDVLAKDGARFTINHQDYNCEGYWPWEHDNPVQGQGVVVDLAMEGGAWMDNANAWRWGLNIRDITDTTPGTPSELLHSGRRIKLTGTLGVNVRVAEGDTTEGIWMMAGNGFKLGGQTVTILSRDRGPTWKDDGSEDTLWAGDPGTGTIDLTDPGEGWLLLRNNWEQKIVDSGLDPAVGWGDNVVINIGGERMLRPNSREGDGSDLWENIFNGEVNVLHTPGANYDASLFAGWDDNSGRALAVLSDVHLAQDAIAKIGRDSGWDPNQQSTSNKEREYRVNLTLDGTDAIVEGYDWWGDDGSGILNDITGQSGGSTLLLRQSDDGNANRYHRLGGTLTDVTIEAQERLIQFVAGCNLNGNIVNINAQGRGDESGIWADPGLGTINYRGGFGAHGSLGVFGPAAAAPATPFGTVESRWGEDTTITIADGMYMFLNVAGDAGVVDLGLPTEVRDVYTNTFAGPVRIQKGTVERNDWGIPYDAEVTARNWYGNNNNNNDQGLKIMRWENIQPDQDTGTRLNQWSDGVYMMADFNLMADYAWAMMCDAGDDWRQVHQRRYFLEQVNDPSGDGRTLRVIGGSLLITTEVTGGANLELEGRWGNPRFGKDILGQGFNMDADSSTTIIRSSDWDNGYGQWNYPFILPADLDTLTDGKFRLVGIDDGGTRRSGNLEIQRGFDGTVDGLLAAVEVDIYNGRMLGATVGLTDGTALTNVIDAPVSINPDTDSGTVDGVLYARHDGATTGANTGTVRYTKVTMQDAGTGNVGTVQLMANGGGTLAKLQIGNTPGDGSGLFMAGDTEVKGGSSDVTIVDVTGASYHELNLTSATGVQLAGTVQASDVNLAGTARMVEGADADISGQFKVGIGSTLEFGPTTTITPEMDVENTSLVHAMTGTTDLGQGVITGVTLAPLTAGLWAGPVAGAFNTGDPNPMQEIQLGTLMADQTATPPWANDTTWVYTGEIKVNNTNGDGTGTIAFAENFDDSVLLVIDGVTYMNDGTWNAPTISDQIGRTPENPDPQDPLNGRITLAEGWYAFEARFGQGGGGAGPVDGWPFGFGYMADASAYVKPAPITSDGFVAPLDPGDMSLFRAVTPPSALITVDAGATLKLGRFTNAGVVTVEGSMVFNNGPARLASDTEVLTIGAAGTLDIGENGLVVDYAPGDPSPLATVVGYVQSGQIMSSDLVDPFVNAIGVVQNDTWAFSPPMATFMGVNLPDGDGSEVLARYTYAGDTDLNGMVDGNDYFNIDWGILFALTGFNNGDVDYSGVIDGNDYFLVDWSFLFQGAPLAGGEGISGGLGVVPEPATMGLLALGAVAMLLRRRRSR